MVRLRTLQDCLDLVGYTGFADTPPPPHENHVPEKPTRRSLTLGLSMPYDWSNPDISDEALIRAVLKQGIFKDVCRICVVFGLDTVERYVPDYCTLDFSEGRVPLNIPPRPNTTLMRMMEDICAGFARAAPVRKDRPS